MTTTTGTETVPSQAPSLPEKTKITTKDLAEKVARQRLSVLQLAQALGNVSEACRRGGLDRTSFYEYKRRFQTHGREGLKDFPPVHKSHPQTTPEDHQKRIGELALLYPTRGCHFLSDQLALEGILVSGPTVQSILQKQGLGSRYERLLQLEAKAIQQESEKCRPDCSDRAEQSLLSRTPYREPAAWTTAVPGHLLRR